ncbi:hypothetical protein [Rathayibacter sp. PhB192]|nr:hypothetical protein [Rathayibacter sp. PhB192]
MTASTSRVADRYLEELKVALADVRAELREEIYGGDSGGTGRPR